MNVAARAEAAAERAAARAAAELAEALPDASVERTGGRIAISGRGLTRRWIELPALRWIAGTLR
jgi:hypothetical protein